MATRSRVYSPEDWQVWSYVPEPGAFRLDFSKWDDGSTWGSTGGSTALVDLPIAGISINESAEPISGVWQVGGGSATISFQLSTFSKAIIAEFYTGKAIWITLKNEETARTHPTFGQATPIFSGYISSAVITYNQLNVENTLTIEVTDSMQYVLNSLLSVNKNQFGALYYKTDDIENAWGAQIAGATSPIDCWQQGYELLNGSGLPSWAFTYETSGIQVDTVGSWLQDYSNTFAGTYTLNHKYSYQIDPSDSSKFLAWKSFFYFNSTLPDFMSEYHPFDRDDIVSIEVGNSIPDKPSVFELTTTAGLTYSTGSSAPDTVNQVISYNQTYNSPLSDLTPISSSLFALENFLSPTAITVVIANENQPIIYDTFNTIYTTPNNLLQVGDVVHADLTPYGFDAEDDYLWVTARDIEVTKETVLATYKVRRTK